MLYLFLDQNTIKVLLLKKTIMGQYELFFFDKQHQTELLKLGKVVSTDLLASAIKEAVSTSKEGLRDKIVYLILPQESFLFLRMTIPSDIAPSALQSFINDKARAEWQVNLEDFSYDYLIEKKEDQSVINLFALEKSVLAKYQEVFTLIDYKIVNVLPKTLACFKLFEKTLRKDKLERILYATLNRNTFSAYLYDSKGLISADKIKVSLPKDTPIETVVKEQLAELEKKGQKLNRLIISGENSETIRQDTFTKDVGLWTNPLKKIVSGFYQDYLKQLVTTDHQSFPILKFDVCFGAFIFSVENKQFSILKKNSRFKLLTHKKISLPKISLPLKETVIFLISFVFSFFVFTFISRSKINLHSFNNLIKTKPFTRPVTPTITNIPTATPTPSFKKGDLKIKILNGSGTRGRAAELKDLFSNKGYGEILTDNADRFDYSKSILQIKKDRQQAAIWIKNDVKNVLPNLKSEVLDASQAADIVLIVGKDFAGL